jgi:phage terminase large subunit
MADVEINLPNKHYRWLLDSRGARFNVLYGGASSAKSWTLAAFLLIEKLYRLPGVGIAAFRKTKPSIRVSCWRLVEYWLGQLKQPFEVNRTELKITAPNGSFMQFGGLDDVEKLKSIEGINYVWLEEATEMSVRDLMQLHIRTRAHNPHEPNQIFLTFNPVDPIGNDWLVKMTELAPQGDFLKHKCRVLNVTHWDNPMLEAEQRDAIEALADADEEYNKIYRLGQWATPTQIIYTNWDIVPEFPDERMLDDVGYGLDFGYVNPSALIKVGIRENDVYVDEVLYESKLHNKDLIARMGVVIPNEHRGAVIVADSAEPAYIDELCDEGWYCLPVQKETGQQQKSFVKTGIDRVKRKTLHITARSTNVIHELRGYKWRVDKDENVLEEPVKFHDHALDALRYYLHEMLKEQELETVVAQVPEWWS